MSPPLARITAAIPAQHRDELEALGGPEGISAGARMAISAGLSALRAGDPMATAGLLPEELHALADRLASITGRRTGAGAYWCPTPEALPGPEALHNRDTVIAMPHALMLVAPDGAIALDLAAGEMCISVDGGEITTELELEGAVGALAHHLPQILMSLMRDGGFRHLAGLRFSTHPDYGLEIAHRGLALHTSIDAGYQFAAEVLSLWTRHARRSAQTRMALEQRLQEVAS